MTQASGGEQAEGQRAPLGARQGPSQSPSKDAAILCVDRLRKMTVKVPLPSAVAFAL
jgi:hypothetical protein